MHHRNCKATLRVRPTVRLKRLMELVRCNLQLNSQQSADSQHSTAVVWRKKYRYQRSMFWCGIGLISNCVLIRKWRHQSIQRLGIRVARNFSASKTRYLAFSSSNRQNCPLYNDVTDRKWRHKSKVWPRFCWENQTENEVAFWYVNLHAVSLVAYKLLSVVSLCFMPETLLVCVAERK